MNGGGGSSGNGPAKRLTAESLRIFEEGMYLILTRWSVLRDVAEQELAGRGSRQLADQLASDVYSWFTRHKANEPLYIDDLEDILDDGTDSLGVRFEDDGREIEEVVEKLMIMHEECLEGNYSSVEKLRSAPVPNAAATHHHITQTVIDDDDDDSSGSEDGDKMITGGESNMMAVDSPVTQPEVDGWTTVVSSRRNRGRRRN
ncbi:unnamed protein product [Linum tenue]|uniref:Pre-rRNA-processing protein TSR2 homolog n=1 Tax=Linum tenue TaxID=586396 RepID=A0AAV0ML63_9ROSI|nr:unnamed protein product [Linum tenue]